MSRKADVKNAKCPIKSLSRVDPWKVLPTRRKVTSWTVRTRRHDHDAGGSPELLEAKAALRDEVWSALVEAKAHRFPGARNRISNFVAAERAAERPRGT